MKFAENARALTSSLLVILLSYGFFGCTEVEEPFRGELTEVRVERAEEGEIPRVLTLNGIVQSGLKADVDIQSEGMVVWVGAQVGDAVKTGQVLAQFKSLNLETQIREQQASLDSSRAEVRQRQVGVELTRAQVQNQVKLAEEELRQAEISLDQARTQRTAARDDLERKETLLIEKAIAPKKVEDARVQLRMADDEVLNAVSKRAVAQANLELARRSRVRVLQEMAQVEAGEADVRREEADLQSTQTQLALMLLRSPQEGVVVERNIEVGQMVTPAGKPPFVLVKNSDLTILGKTDERHLSDLRTGQLAVVTSSVWKGPKDARLDEIVSRVDPETGKVPLRFSFLERPPEVAVDGADARMRLALEVKKGTLIPNGSLRPDPAGGFFVWVVGERKVNRRGVRVLEKNETHTLVLPEGLSPGETVVVEGGESLTEGEEVRLIP